MAGLILHRIARGSGVGTAGTASTHAQVSPGAPTGATRRIAPTSNPAATSLTPIGVARGADQIKRGVVAKRERTPVPKGYWTIWTTVALDLIGFGIIVPILGRYAERFGASGLTVGLLFASFSLAQLVCAPLLGPVVGSHRPQAGHRHLADRHRGRQLRHRRGRSVVGAVRRAHHRRCVGRQPVGRPGRGRRHGARGASDRA